MPFRVNLNTFQALYPWYSAVCFRQMQWRPKVGSWRHSSIQTQIQFVSSNADCCRCIFRVQYYCCTAFKCHKMLHRLKARLSLNGTLVTELWDVTCHMGSDHSVTCHPIQVNAPRSRVLDLPTEPGRMEGWVDIILPGSATSGSRTRDLSVTSPMP